MASLLDFFMGRDTPDAKPLGARLGAAFKRRVGDTLGAIVNNPVARTAGEFANEYWDGTGTPPVAPVPTPVAAPAFGAAPAAPRAFQADVRRVDNALLPPAGPAPLTAAGIRGAVIPPPGTGAFVNNITGAVTNLDTREAGFGAVPQMVDAATYDQMRGAAPRAADFGLPDRTPIQRRHTWAGNAVGAKLNINKATGDARQAAGYAKLGADTALRRDVTAATREGHLLTAATARERTAAESVGWGAKAAKAAAETDEIGIRSALAAEYLRRNPDDVAGASVVFKGGALPGASYTVPATSMADPKTGAIDVLQERGPGAGVIRKVVPTSPAQTATKADFAADMKRMGSKEAVLREYARRNITPPKD